MAGGAHVLTKRYQAVPVLVDPTPDLLRLGERRLTVSGGFSDVTDDPHLSAFLRRRPATDSLAVSLIVFNDPRCSRVPQNARVRVVRW